MKRYLIYFLILIFLVACANHRGTVPPGGAGTGHFGVGATIGTIGYLFTWAGGVGLGLCALAGGLCIFMPAIAALGKEIIETAVISFISMLAGASLIYLGNNPWLLAVCIGLSAILLLLRYRQPVITFWKCIINPVASRRKKTSQPLS